MRLRAALTVTFLVIGSGTIAHVGVAAPTLPGATKEKASPPPPSPPGACLLLNPDLKLDLGTASSRTSAKPLAPVHPPCPNAFIADFEAGAEARGANVRPVAIAPQSWLDPFSLTIWDGHEIPGGDVLKLTSITDPKACAAFKQSPHVYRKVVPTESAFTLVAGGELKPEWLNNSCWLHRPFNFRGQPGTTTAKNVYRLVFTSPGGLTGPINVAFHHDGTSNGE